MGHRRGRSEKFMSPLGVLMLVLAVASCEGKDAREQPASSPSRSKAPEVQRSSPVASYADAVERVAPGVVTIRAARRTRAPRQHPFFNDPALRDLFGGIFGGTQSRGPVIQMGLGSGVIVHPDGTILTNHHVIDGAEAIQVELNNKRAYDAK